MCQGQGRIAAGTGRPSLLSTASQVRTVPIQSAGADCHQNSQPGALSRQLQSRGREEEVRRGSWLSGSEFYMEPRLCFRTSGDRARSSARWRRMGAGPLTTCTPPQGTCTINHEAGKPPCFPIL